METIKRATTIMVVILGFQKIFNIKTGGKVTVTYRCIDKGGSNFMIERLGKLVSCRHGKKIIIIMKLSIIYNVMIFHVYHLNISNYVLWNHALINAFFLSFSSKSIHSIKVLEFYEIYLLILGTISIEIGFVQTFLIQAELPYKDSYFLWLSDVLQDP